MSTKTKFISDRRQVSIRTLQRLTRCHYVLLVCLLIDILGPVTNAVDSTPWQNSARCMRVNLKINQKSLHLEISALVPTQFQEVELRLKSDRNPPVTRMSDTGIGLTCPVCIHPPFTGWPFWKS